MTEAPGFEKYSDLVRLIKEMAGIGTQGMSQADDEILKIMMEKIENCISKKQRVEDYD